jgi:thiamine-phosphate pyrophosphorylase
MSQEMTKPACRLFLATPTEFDLPAFREVMEKVLSSADCASLLLTIDPAERGLIEEAADELMAQAFAHDTAFLLADAPELALELGADGVHITQGLDAFYVARETLGAGRIVGFAANQSRDQAMRAGEAGADYVAFGDMSGDHDFETTLDLTTWWAEVFEIPCVAFSPPDRDLARRLIKAHADFLGLTQTVWLSAQGAVPAVRAVQRLLDSDRAA